MKSSLLDVCEWSLLCSAGPLSVRWHGVGGLLHHTVAHAGTQAQVSNSHMTRHECVWTVVAGSHRPNEEVKMRVTEPESDTVLLMQEKDVPFTLGSSGDSVRLGRHAEKCRTFICFAFTLHFIRAVAALSCNRKDLLMKKQPCFKAGTKHQTSDPDLIPEFSVSPLREMTDSHIQLH